METGKASLDEIKRILENNRGVMLKSNIIGSDFSFLKAYSSNIIFKVEPMVFYNSLSIEENALLSVLFPLNDFVTSGTWPSIAMLNFEKPAKAGKDYFEYIDRVLKILGRRKIKVASGHTGSYGNLDYGVAGSIAFIGFEDPIFDFRRIREDDLYYSIGALGNELSYFKDSGKGTHAPSELSIEIYIREFLRIRKSVHYVHDISEGGLSRGLKEVANITHHGFNVSTAALKTVASKGLRDYGPKLFSVSSSGALIVSISQTDEEKFERMLNKKSWPSLRIEKKNDGVTLDGKSYDPKDSIIDFLK